MSGMVGRELNGNVEVEDDDLDSDLDRYHERERLLQTPPRWAAFMSFLNDLYGLVSLT